MSVCWCGIVVRSQELPCPLCHQSRGSQRVGRFHKAGLPSGWVPPGADSATEMLVQQFYWGQWHRNSWARVGVAGWRDLISAPWALELGWVFMVGLNRSQGAWLVAPSPFASSLHPLQVLGGGSEWP